jgi:hypothetical protein
MTASVKLFSSSMVLTEVTTEKGRVPEASKRGSSLWRLAGSLSLSLSRTRRDGGIPIAQCRNKQIYFFPVVLLLGFFFFFFFLASAWLCVCLSAFPWLGFHSLIFRLGALQTQRPLHTLNTCRCTICGIPYLHYVYVMTGVAEGGAGINRQSSWRETRDSTHHASLSLSICAV